MSRGYKRHHFEEVDGVRWYHYLVPNDFCVSLLDTISAPEEKFIVCVTLPTSNLKKPLHLFTAFDDILAFTNHIKNVPVDNWYYFEVILGSRPQKLYFDIDVKVKEIEGDVDQFVGALLRELIQRVIRTFQEYGHQLDPNRHILLFSSNSEIKRSYHLIIDGFAVANNLENRALAEEILEGFSQGYRECVDPSVYSSKQQFRLFLSQKPHSNRPKRFVENWGQGDSILTKIDSSLPMAMQIALRFTQIFLASAITHTRNCIMIPVLFEEPSRLLRSSNGIPDDDLEITPEMQQEIAQKVDPSLLQIYEMKGVVGQLIILRRKIPAHCSLCKTDLRDPPDPHHTENAFLRISSTGKVYFYCRRCPGESKYLMMVTLPESTELHKSHLVSALQQYMIISVPPPAQSPYSQVRELGTGRVNEKK